MKKPTIAFTLGVVLLSLLLAVIVGYKGFRFFIILFPAVVVGSMHLPATMIAMSEKAVPEKSKHMAYAMNFSISAGISLGFLSILAMIFEGSAGISGILFIGVLITSFTIGISFVIVRIGLPILIRLNLSKNK